MPNLAITGDINSFDYLINYELYKKDTRRFPTGIYLQLVLNTIMFIVFLRNFYYTIGLVIKYPRRIAPWCCMSTTTIGVLFFGICGLLHALPGGPTCRTLLWAVIVGLTVNSVCTSIVLLERAYLAHQCNRRLLGVGVCLILLEPLFFYLIATNSEVLVTAKSGCHIHFSYYLPLVQFFLNAPVNMVLSIAFLIVVYRKYQRYGDKCWQMLMREGTVTMLLVLVSNFLCMILNIVRVFGGITIILYIIEWTVVSTMIMESLRRFDTFTNQPESEKAYTIKLDNTFFGSNIATITVVSFNETVHE
ncbi:hypothetical protein BDF19DRAFT_436409 [Syncephalis fuscata]|nr:hypothetical protein BDF19DRAFT_436409 [Syncephalis fuscata]